VVEIVQAGHSYETMVLFVASIFQNEIGNVCRIFFALGIKNVKQEKFNVSKLTGPEDIDSNS